MFDQGKNRDGKGWKGVQDALDRLTGNIEEGLDRASDAVERGMAGFERKMEGFERQFDEAFARAQADPPKAAEPAGHAKPAEPAPEAPRAVVEPDQVAPASESDVRADVVEAQAAHREIPDDEPAEVKADETGPGFTKRMSKGYAAFVEKARTGVTGAVSRGAEAVDGVAGEGPWRLVGMDERRIRIAREVMRDVVPKVAGDRVASVIDGAAMKGGVAGAGLLLRIPLKGFAVPFLLGITAVETVRAVREVRESVADVAARIDNEAKSAEAYAAGSA